MAHQNGAQKTAADPVWVGSGALDVAALSAGLHRDAQGRAGAVVAFTGVVRADPEDGADVVSLRFEAYAEMAMDELRRIHDDAVQRFAVTGVRIAHRTDTLAVGDEIVAVVVAAPHRDAAFGAASWVMDEIKRRVPLWKHETRRDGSTRWVPGDDCRCAIDEPHAASEKPQKSEEIEAGRDRRGKKP